MDFVAVREAAPSTRKVPARAVGPSNSMVIAFTVNAPVITVSPAKRANRPAVTSSAPPTVKSPS